MIQPIYLNGPIFKNLSHISFFFKQVKEWLIIFRDHVFASMCPSIYQPISISLFIYWQGIGDHISAHIPKISCILAIGSQLESIFLSWGISSTIHLNTVSATITEIKQWQVRCNIWRLVNTRLSKLECECCVRLNDSEVKIAKQISLSTRIHYIHLRANTLAKSKNPPLIPQLCVN